MSEWELVGEAGVDSGQIIVVDPCYVINDEDELLKFAESKDFNDVDATYDELLKARDYVYGTYKGLGYLKKLEAEIKNRGLGNPNYREDWKKEDHSILLSVINNVYFIYQNRR